MPGEHHPFTRIEQRDSVTSESQRRPTHDLSRTAMCATVEKQVGCALRSRTVKDHGPRLPQRRRHRLHLNFVHILLPDPATDIPKRRHTIKNHTDTRSSASGPHTHLHHPPPDIMRHTASWRSPKASASACMTLSTDPVAHHTIVRNFHGRDGPATPLNPLKAIRRRPSMRAGVPAACMHLDSV